MNAYMGCCCKELPCGEVPCPSGGGLLICGTYTISIAAEQTFSFSEDPCCGHIGGKRENTKNSDAYQRLSITFKTILRNNGNGDSYYAGGVDGVGVYTKYFVRASGSGRVYENTYYDNSEGCPSSPPPSIVSRTISNKEINVSAQEAPTGSFLDIGLFTAFFDCADSNEFLQDNCIYEYYQPQTCLQRLRIRFSVQQLAEAALSGSDYLFQFGEVILDDSFSSSQEYEWGSGEIDSSFYRQVVAGDGCVKTENNPQFEVHVVTSLCKPIDYTTDRCTCDSYGLPCEAHIYDTPKPLETYGVGFGDPFGFGNQVEAYADVVPCSMNTTGMSNIAIQYNSYNFFSDCYAVGTCNDVPDPNPSTINNQNETKEVQLEHSLVISKWEYIPYDEMPPNVPNWDDGIACV